MLILHRLQNLYCRYLHFNTSHVNVNPSLDVACHHGTSYFNTSHVNVNQAQLTIYSSQSKDFNTSHVNVNPTNLSLFQSCLNLSLPILSHFTKNYQPIYLYLTMELITLHLQVFTWFLENFFINHLVNIFII